MKCREIKPHHLARGMCHGISRVVAGTWGIFSSYIRNLNLAWQDNTDTSGGEVGDQVSLSSFHRDNGIPIDFHEESSLVSF